MDLSALTQDAWKRLEVHDCEFCNSSHVVHERGLMNIGVRDWSKPIGDSNFYCTCPMCWSMRDGQTPRLFRQQCARITRYNGSAQRERAYTAILQKEAFNVSQQNVANLARRVKRRESHKCQGRNDAVLISAVALALPCWYCGNETSGADRLDSLRCPGYNLDNTVPCCNQCNRMKHVLPRGQFLRHAAFVTNSEGQLSGSKANARSP